MSDQAHPIRPEGARVLITGATSGVGEATARLFASRGAEVALLGRRQQELQRVAGDIGSAASTFLADVSDPASAVGAVHSALEALGRLDVVVNAAGVAESSPLEKLTDDLWREVLDTNLSGAFYISREAGLHMREAGGGSIVNVGSDCATLGAAGLVHYCASKAGLGGLTRGLAIELAPVVRVNAVMPGPIDTPMSRRGIELADDPAKALRDKEAGIPLKRICDADETARAIYFMAIDATFATGTSLAFDGGTTIAYSP